MRFNILYWLFFTWVAGACQPGPDSFQLLLERTTTFDVLIQDGEIIDGTGSLSYFGDLLIKDDTIAFVGEVDTSKITVEHLIDARGKVVTPGFIDPHAHGNPLRDSLTNFLSMGATTIVLGQDGSSAHPLPDHLGWLENKELHVNVAYLVGHGTLRKAVGITNGETANAQQREELQELLRTAIESGAFGMSTGLEYVPGMYADESELMGLATVVGEYNGIIMSHMRNEDDHAIEQSLRELIRQGARSRVHASHLKVVYGKGARRAHEILQLFDSARQQGIEISADVYPYMASYTGISILFPPWAKTQELFNLAVEERPKELEAYLYERIMKRNGPEATLIGTGQYAGKNLAQIAAETGKAFVQLLMEFGPEGASGAYFIMDRDLQDVFIIHPEISISTDGAPDMRHPRGYGTYAKIIEEYVGEGLTLELAIHKMTGLPASVLKLKRRGLLGPGYMADVLVFDPNGIKAKANFTNPFQLAEGFDLILVNGRFARTPGAERFEKHGQVLRFSH